MTPTPQVTTENWQSASSVYEFVAKDLDDNDVSLDKYKGHPLLIVNVATYCGLTQENYKQLNELYNQFKDKGLKILGFPCNQFINQEPGCSVDIKEFRKKNHVEWDVFGKIKVNGDNAHPLYKYLKSKQRGILGFDGVKWNFTKFLVDKNGQPVKRYAPITKPKDIVTDIPEVL